MKYCVILLLLPTVVMCNGDIIKFFLDAALNINEQVYEAKKMFINDVGKILRPRLYKPYAHTNSVTNKFNLPESTTENLDRNRPIANIEENIENSEEDDQSAVMAEPDKVNNPSTTPLKTEDRGYETEDNESEIDTSDINTTPANNYGKFQLDVRRLPVKDKPVMVLPLMTNDNSYETGDDRSKKDDSDITTTPVNYYGEFKLDSRIGIIDDKSELVMPLKTDDSGYDKEDNDTNENTTDISTTPADYNGDFNLDVQSLPVDDNPDKPVETEYNENNTDINTTPADYYGDFKLDVRRLAINDKPLMVLPLKTDNSGYETEDNNTTEDSADEGTVSTTPADSYGDFKLDLRSAPFVNKPSMVVSLKSDDNGYETEDIDPTLETTDTTPADYYGEAKLDTRSL